MLVVMPAFFVRALQFPWANAKNHDRLPALVKQATPPDLWD